MQDLIFRVPGVRTHYYVFPNGTINNAPLPASVRVIWRKQTSYTGTRPKTRPLPIHSYHFNLQDFSATCDALSASPNGYREVSSGPVLSTAATGFSNSPAYDWGPLRNDAISKLNDKVRGDLDLSVSIAEAGQTAKMLKVTERVVSYTRTFTKRFGIIKTPAAAWLEYTYGIKPLVSDIFKCADESLRIVINRIEKYSARASGKYTPTTVRVPTIYGDIWFPKVKASYKVSKTLGVSMLIDQHDPARWSSMNPVSIAWELMPYSFVVDWFLNVGGYLRNMETYLLYASKFRQGYEATLAVSNGYTAELVRNEKYPNGDTHYSKWVFNARNIDIDRIALSSYPAPTLPSFDARLGSSRLLSAASLLAGMLGRRI